MTPTPPDQVDALDDPQGALATHSEPEQPTNSKSITVEFAHTAVNKDMHLFIGSGAKYHDPDLCPECIQPGSLTDGSGLVTIRSNGKVRLSNPPSEELEKQREA